MKLLIKLKDGLLKMTQKQCSSVKNQNLVPEDLYLYYAFYEHGQIVGKMKKLMEERLKAGVTWEQISALHIRVGEAN